MDIVQIIIGLGMLGILFAPVSAVVVCLLAIDRMRVETRDLHAELRASHEVTMAALEELGEQMRPEVGQATGDPPGELGGSAGPPPGPA